MARPEKLNFFRFDELKDNAPVACDAKRKKTGEVAGKSGRVKKRMESITAKQRNQIRKFPLLFCRQWSD